MNSKKASVGDRISILHIDDDVGSLTVSKEILESIGGFMIDTTTAVDSAEEKLKVANYDAIVCDYQMPVKNGLEFLTELRGRKNNVPFILFTGRGREEVAIKALNLGADGYVNRQGDPETVYGELSHLVKSAVARKRAEEKVKESEEKYQTTFESSLDALILVGRNGFFDCNRAALKLFKCKSISDFKKKHPKDWAPTFQPDGAPSKAVSDGHVKKAFETSKDHFFFVHQRSDGTTFPADVLLTTLKIRGETVLQATIRDITKQKEAEQQLKDHQERIALMNEKLLVVGSLTRHDVRNKLSVIPFYSFLLKKKYGNHADIVEMLNKIESSVKDSQRIFEFARMYEQLGVEKLVYIDVEKTVNEAFDLLSNLDLEVINDCHGLELLADSFLRQLFYNFIDNTIKYGEKTTEIRVHFKKNEDYVRLIYEDDGLGITFENKKHLFKQGFSTGGSSGFGLFLIKNMMDFYGWRIKEKGVPGIGAKFEITIPKLNKTKQSNYHINK
jgi:PAS domain S-box-containing protein